MSTVRLEVYRLGLVDYCEALRIQEERRDRLLREEGGPALYLLQHPPTITVGTLGEPTDLLASPEVLRGQGVDLVRTNRGGRITYHGPGQLVGYPVLDLQALAGARETVPDGALGAPEINPSGTPGARGPSVRQYLRDLEETLIRLLARLRIRAARREGETGVWVEDRKIASIGVAVRRWVTLHGFALNVTMDLGEFRLIRPCGFDPGVMTSAAREGGTIPPWHDLESLAAEEFSSVFGLDTAEMVLTR